MASLALIRAEVERALPGALTTYANPSRELIRTGITALDVQVGGIPKGALTQVCAGRRISSGKTTLLLSLIAQLTNQGEFCALVDAGDCFDPASADAAGVELKRVLWVRCRDAKNVKPLEQAFKAADILVQSGGFGLIAIDIGNIDERLVTKIPLTTWFRFSRVVEKLPTALLILSPVPVAQNCATLTLEVRGSEVRWEGSSEFAHARSCCAVDFTAEVTRVRMRKPMQQARPIFTAEAQWA